MLGDGFLPLANAKEIPTEIQRGFLTWQQPLFAPQAALGLIVMG